MERKTALGILAGVLIGVPIGGEFQAYVAYGVYLNQFGLPNDALGTALGVLGVVSFIGGLGVLAKLRTRIA